MSDFSTADPIKKTRKLRNCLACGTKIPIGSGAVKLAGVWDGDFYVEYCHSDCHEAANALNTKNDTWGEEFVWLHDIEDHEDARFILEKFPAVAARLPICDRVAQLDAECEA